MIRLRRTLDRARIRVSMRRGRGAVAIGALLRMIDDGQLMSEEFEVAMCDLVESLMYAVEDAEQEASRNLRVTSRTISHAIRTGGQR